MPSTSILLGRGIVTANAIDLGLCSALTLRHETRMAAIAQVDTLISGGSGELATSTRVFLDFTLHELSADVRGFIWALSDSPTPVPLVWTGVNKMSVDQETGECFPHTLTVPLFAFHPAVASNLILNSLDDSAIPVTGEAMRATDNPSFYTFV